MKNKVAKVKLSIIKRSENNIPFLNRHADNFLIFFNDNFSRTKIFIVSLLFLNLETVISYGI
jgi:hypothetical protein